MKSSTVNLLSTIMFIAGSSLFYQSEQHLISLIGIVAAGFTGMAFLKQRIEGE